MEVLQLPDQCLLYQEVSREPSIQSINQWLAGLFPLTLLMPELCIRNASSCTEADLSIL